MTMQRWDKEQELLDAEAGLIGVLLEAAGSVHPEKRQHLYTTLCQIRVVLTAEIEYCRKPPTVSAYE